MSVLRCSNEDCVTRTDDEEASFSVNVVVDKEGCLAENIKDIYAKYFECNICHTIAERITT